MKKIDDKKFDKRLICISLTLLFISIGLLYIILIFKLILNNLNQTSDYIYLTLSLIGLVFLITSILGLVTLYKRKNNE